MSSRAISVSLMAFLAVVSALALTSSTSSTASASTPDGALSYTDDVADVTVHRLTDDGPDGCVNYMGNLSGEATSWSPDSTRIVYAKRCFGTGADTGIYIHDLAGGERCVSSVGGQWSYPIFDVHGQHVYFIDGADEPRGERGSKPYAVYRVAADTLAGAAADGTCPSRDAVAERVLDIRGAADAGIDDVLVLTKNAARVAEDELFATHVRSGSQWRTIVFSPDGSFVPGWGFDADNPTHNDRNDGDASIWSPHDPNLIFTNRANSPNDRTAARGIWTVKQPRLLHVPADCGGTNSVAHADWIWHPATQTNVIIGNYRCVWSVDANGRTSTSDWRLDGYIHVDADPSSVHGDLADVRFVADEYFDTNGSQPYLYVTTLGDVGIDGGGYSGWSGVRANDGTVGHRNRLDDGSNVGLKAYEPHPQFSPDGRYLLWQSNSLNSVKGHSCPASRCGAAGGDNGAVSFLDIYIADLDPAESPPPTSPPPTSPPTSPPPTSPPVPPTPAPDRLVSVGGRVSNGDDSAAPGVIVDLFVGNDSGERLSYLLSTETADDGGFRFPAIDAGCYVATMIAPEGRLFLDGEQWDQQTRCLLPGATDNTIEAVLRTASDFAGAIVGTVTTSSGEPVTGLTVDLFRANGDATRAAYLWSTSTGSAGDYRLDVEPGCYVLVFIAGPDQRFDNGTGFFEHALCVEPKETTGVDVGLAP